MRLGNANLHHAAMTSIDKPVPAAVAVTLMGGFGVAVDGVPTNRRGWARRDTVALVKVLALAPGHHLHREHVMDLLWPDESTGGVRPASAQGRSLRPTRRRTSRRDRAAQRCRVALPRRRGDRRRDPVRAAGQGRGRSRATRTTPGRPSPGTGASCCPATATRPGWRTAVSCCTCAGSMCCGSPASGGTGRA